MLIGTVKDTRMSIASKREGVVEAQDCLMC